jgi:hypothetical protein
VIFVCVYFGFYDDLSVCSYVGCNVGFMMFVGGVFALCFTLDLMLLC